MPEDLVTLVSVRAQTKHDNNSSNKNMRRAKPKYPISSKTSSSGVHTKYTKSSKAKRAPALHANVSSGNIFFENPMKDRKKKRNFPKRDVTFGFGSFITIF